MPQGPSKFQRAKPRAKTTPARRVMLSEEERRKIEQTATETAKKDETYTRHLPAEFNQTIAWLAADRGAMAGVRLQLQSQPVSR